ncbi:hypothetical protein N7540_012890 [Penicillium herquei]|nr:hypothetical protein N7540_012890 [Penicillium herquei]
MRSFIAIAILIAGVTAQTTSDYLKCAEAAFDGIDVSTLEDCSNKSSTDCLCSNSDALSKISDSAAKACSDAGVDLDNLQSAVCSSDREAAPARHASNPMEPASNMHMNMHMADGKRAYAPPAPAEAAAPRVIYVTETKTECGCRATPSAFDPSHLSQIPVDVPASSSMAPMGAASTPVYSHGILVGAASSSRAFGSQMAATPTPSGASANRFNTFKGAASQVDAARGGIAALGVAAVMGLVIAL